MRGGEAERGAGRGRGRARARANRSSVSLSLCLRLLPFPPSLSLSLVSSYPAQVVQVDVQGGALPVGDGLLRSVVGAGRSCVRGAFFQDASGEGGSRAGGRPDAAH